MGQLLTEDGSWASDSVSHSYNHRRLVTLGLQWAGEDWIEVGYLYDAAGRMTHVGADLAGMFGYTYDAQRPTLVSRLSLPNGSYITNTYDGMARLLSTLLKNSTNGVLNSHNYGYNVGSQRTALTNTAGDYRNYTYDNIGQLKMANGFESGGATRLHEQMGYAYDAAGNLNLRTNHALVQTFNVNALNGLSTVTRSGTLTVAGTTTSAATNVTVNSLTATRYGDYTFARTNLALVDGSTNFTAIAQNVAGRSDTNTVTVNLAATITFVYDLNGNLRTNGSEILEYDDENRLVTNWVAGAWKSEFVYDGKNRRRVQRDYGWNGSWVKTNETRFIYDGNVIVQHRDANNAPVLTLTRGRDLSGTLEGAGGIGGLLAMTEGSSTHSYYHADGNGNVTALINAGQLIVAKAAYEPFGGFLSLTGPKAGVNPYWFSSKPIHWQSGKYDFLYRWYVPSLQRWPNRDPIGEEGGLSLYAYVRNAPMNLIDPFGKSWVSSCGSWLCANAAAAGVNSDMQLSGINGNDDRGGGNAFRHCLSGCKISQQCGKGGEKSWDGREDPKTGRGKQDLDNNKVGYGQAGKKGSCWDNCMDAWENGGLHCGQNPFPPPKQRVPEPKPGDPAPIY